MRAGIREQGSGNREWKEIIWGALVMGIGMVVMHEVAVMMWVLGVLR